MSSVITVTVYDSRRTHSIGFMGMTTLLASAYFDSRSLSEGATCTHSFRLKKRTPDDIVTGTITLRLKALRSAGAPSPSSPRRFASEPIPVAFRPSTPVKRLPSSPLSQSVLPESPFRSFVPPKPEPPTCIVGSDGEAHVDVLWADLKAPDVRYTLAVAPAGTDRYADIYTGTEPTHRAVGLKGGQKFCFAVKASNFYGSSEYSEPSETVDVPVTQKRDEREHCPLFMAGFCFRGASCPYSHGTGMQTPDDVAAALLAASFMADPDIQLRVAMAASLSDFAVPFNTSSLSQYKRDFHAKEMRFRQEVAVMPGECRFSVVRSDLFKSSFFEVTRRQPSELKKRLCVQFYGEGGLDYGGLAREWFFLLSHEVFHSSYGMFEYSRHSAYRLQINPNSSMDPDHLLYFQFIGRVMGMAILHHHLLDAAFVVSLYKKILGLPVLLSDMQDVDPDVHRSLLWLLENKLEGDTGMTFAVDYDHFGDVVSHELAPDGASIMVTEENKHEFVRLMVEWRLSRGTDSQFSALQFGLHEIVPRSALVKFTESELEALLSGTQQLDLDDWAQHTTYQDCTANSDVVKWFWNIVKSLDSEKQLQLLQFCTGSSRVPLEGFQGLQGSDGPRRFCIQMIPDANRLPNAHTCFNRLDLPKYASESVLRSKLLYAMDGAQGFTGD